MTDQEKSKISQSNSTSPKSDNQSHIFQKVTILIFNFFYFRVNPNMI